MEKKTAWILLIVLLIVFGGLIGIALLYYFYVDNRKDQTIVCTSDFQCDVGAFCNTSGVCETTVCTSDSQCYGSQICLGGYCIEKACNSQSGCVAGETCYKGECIPSGNACTSLLDCNNGALPCIGNVCQQCQQDSDCSNGYCNSGVCTNDCSGGCGSGSTCVQNTREVCCADPDGTCGKQCTVQGTGSCKYCVNGMLTCKKGETSSICTVDDDCSSGKCLLNTAIGNVCAYVNSQECVSNYIPGVNNKYSCGSGSPFCVSGLCNTKPLGSLCGDDYNNTCRTANQNTSDPTQNVVVKDPYSYYCVNDFCRLNPGAYGEKCSVDDDCAYAQAATNSVPARLACINSVCS
jgi:hypothetical protein